jgi:hypothetical protein
MKQVKLNVEEAPNKFWASRDARMRNIAGASHYTETQKIQAERMKLGLELCYTAKGIYINYRDKFIAVKVAGARVKDRVELVVLEAEYAKLGVTKAETPQGTIYRIPKVV